MFQNLKERDEIERFTEYCRGKFVEEFVENDVTIFPSPPGGGLVQLQSESRKSSRLRHVEERAASATDIEHAFEVSPSNGLERAREFRADRREITGVFELAIESFIANERRVEKLKPACIALEEAD